MTTPILMLFLMTAPWLLAQARLATGRRADPQRAGVHGLIVLFIFTALGHFAQTGAMAQMLPQWVPAREALVLATGVLELAIAAGLMFARTRRLAGWSAAAVLVLFFPANIYAALEHVPMGGHAWGPVYLLVRAPLQLAILAWVAAFTLRRAPVAAAAWPVARREATC